jgi:hypothetical protein
MTIKRILGSMTAVVALVVAVFLYSTHAAKSSDHQDSPTVVARTGADITDVYVFPSPTNAANVVLVMDVDPLITPGAATASANFDPSVLYQFKIAHGAVGTTTPEDTVIQLTANGTGSAQTLNVYGPAAPAETGVNSTLIAKTGTFPINVAAGTTLGNGIKAFAGTRADPFFFDLFQFFTILPDRNYSNPRTGNTLGTSTPSFNGFTAGDTNAGPNTPGAFACSTAPSSNALTQAAPPGFNVLAVVLEIPKTLLVTGGQSSIIHVWATTSTTSGS